MTRVLKDSISNNSINLLIGCINPLDTHLEETLNTLNFTESIRKVKIEPKIYLENNNNYDKTKELIKENDNYKCEIIRIKNNNDKELIRLKSLLMSILKEKNSLDLLKSNNILNGDENCKENKLLYNTISFQNFELEMLMFEKDEEICNLKSLLQNQKIEIVNLKNEYDENNNADLKNINCSTTNFENQDQIFENLKNNIKDKFIIESK